jgi:hypothetical protein
VTITGVGFGPAPRNTSLDPITFPADGSGISLAVAATLPTVALRVNMHRGCVSDSFALDGSVLPVVSSCSHGSVVSHSDSSLVVLSATGIGVDRTFSVVFIEGSGTNINVVSSNSLRWDFDPPSISLTIPNVMLVADVPNTSPLALLLKVSGSNFGSFADADRDGWTPLEQAVSLGVNGVDCTGATRGQQGSLPVIECSVPLLPSGPHNISIGVAGQNTTLMSADAVR